MGAGNILKSCVRAENFNARALLVPGTEQNTRARRINLSVRYSPLMSNYLKLKNYEAQNAIKNWEMRYTLRNEEREQKQARKMKYYCDEVTAARELQKKLNNTYRSKSKDIDDQCMERQKSYHNFMDTLAEKYKQKMAKHGAHGMANKIVTLSKEDDPRGYTFRMVTNTIMKKPKNAEAIEKLNKTLF